MSARSYILATAGHVDHGKSSLVHVLTGIDPDRLPEEKARGMTIELGFSELRLRHDEGTLEVGIVDVPGHGDLVRNMVAGVAAADAALLVVAADDGWMPQTEEHLGILAHLGVARGVVALTKSDLAPDLATMERDVRGRLRGTPFADAPIVPTSILTGAGLDVLRETLATTLAVAPAPVDVNKPRLAVDRAFSVRGAGTVVTGTLVGGSLSRGQVVVVRPGGATAHVRGLQTHGREMNSAVPGSRVALNLPELELAERGTAGAKAVRRGDVVTLDSVGVTTSICDVMLHPPLRGDAPPLAAGRVTVHCGTAAIPATLRRLSADGPVLARLRLERPALLMAGDRLLLRDSGQRWTLGGATVLDPAPPGRRVGPKAQLALLETRSRDLSAATLVQSATTRDGVVALPSIERVAPVPLNGSSNAMGSVHRVGDWLVSPAAWKRAATAVLETIAAHHRDHPEQSGIPAAAVRAVASHAIGPHVSDAVAAAVLDELCAKTLERVGATIRDRSHSPALPGRLRAAGEALLRTLKDRPFDPPSRRELAPNDAAGQALRFLIASAAVVELGPDVVLSAAAFAAAAEAVRTLLRGASAGATVSEIKRSLGSSRRIVVPLLERLDRDGITRRVGDARVLREP